MSQLWTDNQISAWAQEGEEDISNKQNLIIDRIGLSTVAQQTLFNLPDQVLNISRITYRGFKLEGKNAQELVDSQSSPNNSISYSRPLFYIYNGYGLKTIKVLSAISETTSAPSGDLFSATAIRAGLIIEFYRTPDFTTEVNRVSQPMRKILVKYYLLYRALQQDGPGLDLKGSDFFKQLYDQSLQDLKIINNATFLSRVNVMGDISQTLFRGWKARPILPPNYPVRY